MKSTVCYENPCFYKGFTYALSVATHLWTTPNSQSVPSPVFADV